MPNLNELFPGVDAAQMATLQRQGSEQSLMADLMQQLGAIDAQQAPQGQPVPQGIDPFAEMAGTFTSQLAEQLGARGSVGAMVGMQAEAAAQPGIVQAGNAKQQREFFKQKQEQRLDAIDQTLRDAGLT